MVADGITNEPDEVVLGLGLGLGYVSSSNINIIGIAHTP